MGRQRRLLAVTLAASLQFVGPASAQDWPTRPVTMVIAFPAGGSTDIVGRIFAPRLSELLGQQVIVENVVGSGTMGGAYRVAKAAPDGYEFMIGHLGTHAQYQTIYKSPLYDAATDFAPVALLVEQPQVLVTREGFAGQRFAGVCCLREGQPDDDAIRLRRSEFTDVSRLLAAQYGDRGQCHARPLSRQRAGDAGSDRGPHRLHVRRPCGSKAADRG